MSEGRGHQGSQGGRPRPPVSLQSVVHSISKTSWSKSLLCRRNPELEAEQLQSRSPWVRAPGTQGHTQTLSGLASEACPPLPPPAASPTGDSGGSAAHYLCPHHVSKIQNPAGQSNTSGDGDCVWRWGFAEAMKEKGGPWGPRSKGAVVLMKGDQDTGTPRGTPL